MSDKIGFLHHKCNCLSDKTDLIDFDSLSLPDKDDFFFLLNFILVQIEYFG